jgi:hypothetical protein
MSKQRVIAIEHCDLNKALRTLAVELPSSHSLTLLQNLQPTLKKYEFLVEY